MKDNCSLFYTQIPDRLLVQSGYMYILSQSGYSEMIKSWKKKIQRRENHFFFKKRFIKRQCRICNPSVNDFLEATEAISGIGDTSRVLITLTVLCWINVFQVSSDLDIQFFFVFNTIILTFFCFCRLKAFDKATIERAFNTQQFFFPFFSFFDELGDRVRFKSNSASVSIPLFLVLTFQMSQLFYLCCAAFEKNLQQTQ